jgi:hypothetical protein
MPELSNMEIIVRSLDRLVQRSLSEIFIEGVVTDNNRDEFMIQALGILVSHWTRWDAGKIMDVFMAALQDVNYDGLMEQIQTEIIDNPRSKLYT